MDRRAARAKQILFGEFGFVGCFLLAWGFLTAEKSIIQICIKRLRKMQNVMRANMKESEGMRHCLRQEESEGKKLSAFLKFIVLCLVAMEMVKKIETVRIKFSKNKTAKTKS